MSWGTEVWYVKAGYDFSEPSKGGHEVGKFEAIPLPLNDTLSDTHALVAYGNNFRGKDINKMSVEEILTEFMAHSWAPNGEAKFLIERLKVDHVTIRTGDVVVKNNHLYIVEGRAFRPLGTKPYPSKFVPKEKS